MVANILVKICCLQVIALQHEITVLEHHIAAMELVVKIIINSLKKSCCFLLYSPWLHRFSIVSVQVLPPSVWFQLQSNNRSGLRGGEVWYPGHPLQSTDVGWHLVCALKVARNTLIIFPHFSPFPYCYLFLVINYPGSQAFKIPMYMFIYLNISDHILKDYIPKLVCSEEQLLMWLFWKWQIS